jgi:hypothetical protein
MCFADCGHLKHAIGKVPRQLTEYKHILEKHYECLVGRKYYVANNEVINYLERKRLELNISKDLFPFNWNDVEKKRKRKANVDTMVILHERYMHQIGVGYLVCDSIIQHLGSRYNFRHDRMLSGVNPIAEETKMIGDANDFLILLYKSDHFPSVRFLRQIETLMERMDATCGVNILLIDVDGQTIYNLLCDRCPDKVIKFFDTFKWQSIDTRNMAAVKKLEFNGEFANKQ